MGTQLAVAGVEGAVTINDIAIVTTVWLPPRAEVATMHLVVALGLDIGMAHPFFQVWLYMYVHVLTKLSQVGL